MPPWVLLQMRKLRHREIVSLLRSHSYERRNLKSQPGLGQNCSLHHSVVIVSKHCHISQWVNLPFLAHQLGEILWPGSIRSVPVDYYYGIGWYWGRLLTSFFSLLIKPAWGLLSQLWFVLWFPPDHDKCSFSWMREIEKSIHPFPYVWRRLPDVLCSRAWAPWGFFLSPLSST